MSSTLDDDSRDRASRSRDEKAEKGGRSPRAAQIEVSRGVQGGVRSLGWGKTWENMTETVGFNEFYPLVI